MKNAVIYCRVSTTEQADEGTSLVSQEKVCRAYALAKGYTVKKVLSVDEPNSIPFRDREVGAQAWAMLENDDVTAIIIQDPDRYSRNMDDAATMSLSQRGKREGIVLTTQETKDPQSRFMFHIYLSVATLERETIKARTQGGRHEKFLLGHNARGNPPYGVLWNKETKKWSEDPEAADVVRMIYDRYLRGEGTESIARFLDASGFPPPGLRVPNLLKKIAVGPAVWPKITIATILKNYSYMGLKASEDPNAPLSKKMRKTKLGTRRERVEHKVVIVAAEKDGTLRVPVPADFADFTPVARSDYPIIVRPQVWLAVANMRVRRRHVRKEAPDQYPRILSGRIKCVECGQSFRATTTSAGSKHWKCNGRWTAIARQYLGGETCPNETMLDAREIDWDVWLKLYAQFSTPAGYQEAVRHNLDNVEGQIAALAKSLGPIEHSRQDLEQRKADLVQLKVDGMLAEADYAKRVAVIQKAEANLVARAGERPEELEALEQFRADREHWLAVLDSEGADGHWIDAITQMEKDAAQPDSKPVDWAKLNESNKPPLMLEKWVRLLDVKVEISVDGLRLIRGFLPGEGPFAVESGEGGVPSLSRKATYTAVGVPFAIPLPTSS